MIRYYGAFRDPYEGLWVQLHTIIFVARINLSSKGLSQAEVFLHGYELPSYFPLQSLIIVPISGYTIKKMMIVMIH